MTPEEKAWCELVHRQSMEIVGICGLLELRAPAGSPEAARGRRAGLAALALASEAARRMNDAGIQAEQQEVAAGGYDLAALAMAAPATIED